jgi:hypothetical protein
LHTVWYRLGAYSRTAETKGFIAGLFTAALWGALAPGIKRGLRPLAVKATQGFLAISEQSKKALGNLEGSMKEIALEARKIRDEEFANLGFEKDEIQRALEEELKNHHQASLDEINELKNQLASLKSQFDEIKNNPPDRYTNPEDL